MIPLSKLCMCIRAAAIALATFGFAEESVAGKSQCSDVLHDGTKAIRLLNENSTYRRLLETKLLNMTSKQARTDTSLTGNIPVGDIVLGAGFTDKSFEDYKSYLQKNTSLFIDTTHALDVMLSTGDPEILAAWSGCMQNRSGLSLRFTDIHSKSAVLVIEWFPAAGVAEVKIAQDYQLPKNVVVTSGMAYLNGTMSIVAGTSHEVKFELVNPQDTLALTLNAVTGKRPRGADSAFLPARMKLMRETRKYDFNVLGGICSDKPTIFLDAPHHSGTVLPTTTYCSSLTSGWRFSKEPEDYSVTTGVVPSYVPGTQIANAPHWWTGDDQFNVALGCSSSTGTDIQCSATTRLVEERYVWIPSSD